MASVQTKITFPCRKKSFRLSKKVEKENKTSRARQIRSSEGSPLKSQTPNVNADLKSPKRHSTLDGGASPPKIKFTSPSQLIENIQITSQDNDCFQHSARKELFKSQQGSLSSARKALHSALPSNLPTREDKLEELTQVLNIRLNDRKCDSLYVCGPPGTGKTACLKSIIAMPEIQKGYRIVFINCTGLKSSGAIYSRICHDLNLKSKGRSEKSYQQAIQKYLTSSKKMNLFVLDEMDQLESRGQTVLYSILEWSKITNKDSASLVIIGIANSLDLTERALPRLAGHADIKPKVIHFAPYTRDQIVSIINHRLAEANCKDIFGPGALQLLASKIATISGDVRRALDISTRLIDILQTQGETITVSSVLETVNSVYSTSDHLTTNNKESSSTDSFPLQQKLMICSLMLVKLKSKMKDVTIGRLHDVYKKVCEKRNLPILGMTEFMSLVELVEVRGIILRQGKQISRMTKLVLQWDYKEVSSALQDKNLLASILDDVSCISI